MTNVNIGGQIGQQKDTAIANSKGPFCKDNPDVSAVVKTDIDPRAKAISDISAIGGKDISLQLKANSTDPRLLSDDKLFLLCQQYGNNAKMWKRKFEELLPEVMKRELYRRKRFISIYEFAAKVAGLSYDTVDRVLRVYKQLEDKPKLRALIVEFGWSKLQIISGIATVDTDESWAEKVRVLPKSSLETIVRDFRKQAERKRLEFFKNEDLKNSSNRSGSNIGDKIEHGKDFLNHTGCMTGNVPMGINDTNSPNRKVFPGENLPFIEKSDGTTCLIDRKTGEICDPLGACNSLKADFGTNEFADNGWPIMSFKVDPETEFRLRKLKLQIEKERKVRLSFNQFFKIMIERAEWNATGSSANKGLISAQKERLAEKKIQSVSDESVNVSEHEGTAKSLESTAERRPATSDRTKLATDSDDKSKAKSLIAEKSATSDQTKFPSRHIPTAIKNFLIQKYKGRCGFPGCEKPFEVFHHVQRFALGKAHDPGAIVPLCKEHHDVAHGGWIGNETDRGGTLDWSEMERGGTLGEINGDRNVMLSWIEQDKVGTWYGIDPDKWEIEHDIKRFLTGYAVDEIVRGCKENWEKRRLGESDCA